MGGGGGGGRAARGVQEGVTRRHLVGAGLGDAQGSKERRSAAVLHRAIPVLQGFLGLVRFSLCPFALISMKGTSRGIGEGDREHGAGLGAEGWRNEPTFQRGRGGRGPWEMSFSRFP